MSSLSDSKRLQTWIESVIDPAEYGDSLEAILELVPSLADFGGIPPSSLVLVRADIDVPIKDGRVADVTRLESFRHTIEYCREHRLIPVIFGHVGRDARNTAMPVAAALEELYGSRVIFVDQWFDERNAVITKACRERLSTARPGELVLLENTRMYSFERELWNVTTSASDTVATTLDRVTREFCQTISQYYIFDALAASNLDWSSVVVPAYVSRAALAEGISKEFNDHVRHARQAQVVIFSGLKLDKLDDLEMMLSRRKVKLILVGGALATALMKARALLEGKTISIGLADSNQSKDSKFHIGQERVEQAKRIMTIAVRQGVEVVLPVDFVLDDGSVSATIPQGSLQLDVGPRTLDTFEEHLMDFVGAHKKSVIFHNGVLGKFEDERFEAGTRQLINLLRVLTDAGARTYVGGGEGLLALRKYGDESWVTHAFTSGGTILKAMSGRVISYLNALAYYSYERNRVGKV